MNGATPKTSVSDFWDGSHAWITPAEMAFNGKPNRSETRRTLSEKGLQSCSASLLPPHSIILSSRAPIGHLVINEVPMATNQGCKGLVPSNDVHYEYLYHFLVFSREQLNGLGTGATFSELSATKLKAVTMPLPSLDDQRRIVAKLDQAFAEIDRAIENTERAMQESESILATERDRLLVDRSDWECITLGNLVEIKHGLAFTSEWFTDQGDLVLLTPGNFFETGGYRYRGDKQKYYAGDVPDDYVLKPGDLLVAMTEQAAGLLGSPLIVPDDGVFLHNQRLGLIQPIDTTRWHTGFFFHVFNTRHFRAVVHAMASGVKVRHTSPKKLSAVTVWIPSNVSEMNRVAQQLDTIAVEAETLSQVYQKKLTALRTLKQSILAETFSFPEVESA